MLQPIRRIVQASIILLILFIPIFSYYGTLLAEKGQREVREVAREETGPVSALVYVAIDKVISPPSNPAETIRAIDPFKGGVWSINLFDFNITDPLAALAATLGGKAIYIPLLVSIIIPLVFILIFGRAFCGWLCPMNTLFELTDRFRGWVGRLGLPTLDIHLDRRYKYLVLVACLLLALWGFLLFPYILPYALVTREIYLYIFYGGLGFGSALILILLLFELLISRRGWCRYLCPGGAFFSLLGSMRVIGVTLDMGRCGEGCDLCTVACKMGLEPHRDKIGMECDNCGLCISACPSKAIRYRVKGQGSRGMGQRVKDQGPEW